MLIQTRREAVGAWRRLDRRTRHDLLNSRTPHPDPRIAAIAAAYAGASLGRAAALRRAVLPTLWTTLILVTATVAAVVVEVTSGSKTGFTILPLLTVGAIVVYVWRLMRRQIALTRMETLNSRSLPVAAPPPMPSGTPSGGEPLVVGYDFKALRGSWALSAVLIIGVPAVAIAIGRPYIYIPMTIAMGAMAIFTIVSTARVVARRKTPVLVLDSTGVSLPHHDFTVPWPQIATVRVLPMPRGTGRRGEHRVIVFVPVDNQLILQSAPPKLANSMRRTMGYYGSPIVVMDKGLSAGAEEIVHASAALGGVQAERTGAAPTP
ncbi:hypothetical protein GCM10023194_60460 [Planotetraspora phitsanulokensis]|uniref:PH domain-containing protein n=1 Tax=Planotetraspora phitsanulokensis TaxID=575192 RepID=A0A8J3U353_9ACTN|nr:hypothetical protein [Planotetraspora phitsanulokensis]GII37733.1 hypothetical protein Pph01_27360 [Planotetraspora phitsanulokensis]